MPKTLLVSAALFLVLINSGFYIYGDCATSEDGCYTVCWLEGGDGTIYIDVYDHCSSGGGTDEWVWGGAIGSADCPQILVYPDVCTVTNYNCARGVCDFANQDGFLICNGNGKILCEQAGHTGSPNDVCLQVHYCNAWYCPFVRNLCGCRMLEENSCRCYVYTSGGGGQDEVVP